jgi:hypothetical protein
MSADGHNLRCATSRLRKTPTASLIAGLCTLAPSPYNLINQRLREALEFAISRKDVVGSHENLTKIAAELGETGLVYAAQIVEEAAEHAHHEDEICCCPSDLKWRLWAELPAACGQKDCGCWTNLQGEANYPAGYWKQNKASGGVEMIWNRRNSAPVVRS